VLSLKNIQKKFGSNVILDDICVDINDQEFLVLVGPSGSGKSTLIRILAGLEQQDSGEILFAGEDITIKPPKDRSLSMVFQNYALYPHKTVFENIAFPLKISGCKAAIVNEKIQRISEQLNITDLLDRKPGQLSGGQRQRVALARAMAKDPKIFLLDEPLSNLDAKLRSKMRKEIFNLHKNSNAIFVYVTHDQIEALTLGDRVVVLDAGKIQQIGTPYEIYNNPKNIFVASFIGNPSTNLLKNICNEKIVGIRPEFFKLYSNSGNDIEFLVSLKNIEMIGSDYLLYLETRDHSEELIAKLPCSSDLDSLYRNQLINKEQYKFSLFVAENLLYYFSKANGKRLEKAVSKEL
jgi:multiple sugar transport system ATP-binding protein